MPISMTTRYNVTGMSCAACSTRVEKAVEKAGYEALPGVEEAVADHKSGTATVTLIDDVADSVLKSAVEEEGYKVL